MQETQETQVQSLGQEDSLKKEMASHTSLLSWKAPWTEEPGMVRHDLATEKQQHSKYNSVKA